MIPSNTIINTAGSGQLSASKSGLLSMYLKDSKGNLHENALVIQSLSQNLTSHTQFVAQGHLVYFHKSGSGIVLNKVPKFNPADVIIPFVDGPNGLQYVEEYLPEEETVMAMVAD